MAQSTGQSRRRTPRLDVRRSVNELVANPGQLPLLWGRRGFWQTKLRWAVAPVMVAGVLVGHSLGFELPAIPILIIAAASVVYNAIFSSVFIRCADRLRTDPALDRLLTMVQVSADYAAMFLLIYFTGGVWSPVLVFLIFHVIIAAIQFSPGVAHLLAALAAGGLWLLLILQSVGTLPQVVIFYRGQPLHFVERPLYAGVMLVFFTATLFITASMVGAIMRRLRDRVGDLAETTGDLARANHKMRGLYKMVGAIGTERRMEPILTTVTAEVARVLEVPAVAVKLLDEDGETLRYVAAHGLPDELLARTIQVSRSPLNCRILAGETLVHGQVGGEEALQLQVELTALGVRSAVLAPLRIEERVIGMLGVYSDTPDRFDKGDTDFLRLAAELVAIAIEDARTSEAIEKLMQERTQFMLEVAHNLRAPLGASLGMLELLSDEYLGQVSERQLEYLQRIDARLRSLHRTIGELLTIARARDWDREIPDVVVDLADLARYTERTFRDEAEAKRLRFRVVCDDDVPRVDSGANLLEQVMDNLVSNAIKYTPEEGQVEVHILRDGSDQVKIVVRDTGIGIPVAEQDKLFREFFRATNAKKHTREGTGLGLTLVQQSVERHGGRMVLTSAEGEGTTVEVRLPVHQPKRVAGQY